MKLYFTLRQTIFAAVCLGTTQTAQADFTTVAINNGIIQPAGPRTGANGKKFFNIEGSNNGSNASFGVIDFPAPAGTSVTGVNALSLTLVESNSSFTAKGGLGFYLTQDTTTNIEPTTSPLTYQATNAPEGIGTQLDPKFFLGTGTFGSMGSSGTGTVDTYTFALSGAAQTYLTNEINTGSNIRLIVVPEDATVAATYAGFSNTTATTPGPSLTVTTPATTPEPDAVVTLLFGVVNGGVFLRKRHKSA